MIEKALRFGLSSETSKLLNQRCKTLNHLKQIHAHLLTLPSTGNTAAAFLSFAATSANPAFFSYASIIFQNLRPRTTFLYNTMIRGYMKFNQPSNAILCYKDMLKDGLIKNNYTFTPLIKACSLLLPEFGYLGLSVHAHVVKLGFVCDPFIASALIEFYALNLDMRTAEELFDEIPVRDVVLWTAMVVGYGKMGDIVKARELFDEMPERNVISWSSIMAVYSRVSDFREVLFLYRRMEESGLKPNESILVTTLTACAHLGALAQGLWIHSYAEKCNYISNPILATALVDMYSKCGCVSLALTVFESIPNKDNRAWNAVISGVALNGDAMNALQLFDEMIISGTQPTEATFVAILSACTHAKMVEKGISLFEKMAEVYKIEPKMEHYACVVDLFARSGEIEKAVKFVDENIGRIGDGDVNVWGALLGACRIYGKVDVGHKLWRKIADKGDVDYGIQVLAYNMYRESGWESEAKRVRRLIEKRRMKKKPGCSVIEIDGVVEEFVAGDILHPMGGDLCQILDSLLSDEHSN
ncbi:hypothetical protein ACS0TY_026371 [Phlomoides rotata]